MPAFAFQIREVRLDQRQLRVERAVRRERYAPNEAGGEEQVRGSHRAAPPAGVPRTAWLPFWDSIDVEGLRGLLEFLPSQRAACVVAAAMRAAAAVIAADKLSELEE